MDKVDLEFEKKTKPSFNREKLYLKIIAIMFVTILFLADIIVMNLGSRTLDISITWNPIKKTIVEDIKEIAEEQQEVINDTLSESGLK